MPDFSWSPRSPLHKAIAGRQSARPGAAGVTLTELRDFELVQVMARRGKWPETAAACKARLGVAPSDGPSIVAGPDSVLVWSGPGQFLVLSKGGENTVAKLKPSFGGAASLSDQSSGRVLIRVSGTRMRAMLAKLCSVDLDEREFPTGRAAATSIDHTGVNLWRGSDVAGGVPGFYLLILATYADSICHALVDASAEYGVDLLASGFGLDTAL